jgi:hypothetical protein
MKPAILALAAVACLGSALVRGGEPNQPPPTAADDLHTALIGHWREKAKLGEDQADYYFGPDKCVVHTKTVQGESFTFYDYSIWQAWPGRRTLILALRDDAEAVKWVLEFGVDNRQITYRERNKKTFTKPVILTRVDDKTEP